MRFRKSYADERRPHTQRGTVRMQGVVESFLRERGWSDKLKERRVFDVWESVVGKVIAAQSAPVSLSGGVLRVEVSHPVYANELSVMKTVIITKLKSELEDMNSRRRGSSTTDKVVDIQFHFNPRFRRVKSSDTTAKPETNQTQVLKSVPPEMSEQIEAAVSVINDFELRDALKTLFLTQCSDTETTE